MPSPKPVNFILVIVPNISIPAQINTLSDIEKIGGKIIDTYSMNVTFTEHP
jgi:hypothetical protein